MFLCYTTSNILLRPISSPEFSSTLKLVCCSGEYLQGEKYREQGTLSYDGWTDTLRVVRDALDDTSRRVSRFGIIISIMLYYRIAITLLKLVPLEFDIVRYGGT